MMECLATVVDNSQSGKLLVSVSVTSACEHCSSDETCGNKSVAKAFTAKQQQLEIETELQYPVGEQLKLGLPESILLKSAFLVYLSPLFGLFLFGLISQNVMVNLNINSDIIVILSSFLGAFLTWLLAKKFALKLEHDAKPIILSSLGKAVI